MVLILWISCCITWIQRSWNKNRDFQTTSSCWTSSALMNCSDLYPFCSGWMILIRSAACWFCVMLKPMWTERTARCGTLKKMQVCRCRISVMNRRMTVTSRKQPLRWCLHAQKSRTRERWKNCAGIFFQRIFPGNWKMRWAVCSADLA